MRTLAKAAAVVVVALLVVAGGVVAWMQTDAFHQWFTARVSDALGPQVDVGSASPALRPAPAVVMRDLRFRTAGESQAEIGRAPRARGTLGVWPLLLGRVELTAVRVEQPSLELERATDGSLPALGGGDGQARRRLPRVEITGGALDLVDRAVAGGPVRLSLSDLELTLGALAPGDTAGVDLGASVNGSGRLEAHGSAHLPEDATGLGDVSLDGTVSGTALPATALHYLLRDASVRTGEGRLDVETSVSGAPAELEGDGTLTLDSGTVTWAALRLDAPVEVSGTFSLAGDGVRLSDTRIDAAGTTLGSFRAGQGNARLGYEAGRLAFQELQLDAYAGSWTSSRTVVRFGDDRSFETDVRVDGAQLRPLARDLAGSDVKPQFQTLSGQATLSGQWRGDWRRSIDGSGELTLRGGETESSSILTAIWHALLPKVGPLETVSPLDLLDPLRRPTDLDHLALPFEAARGDLRTDALEVASSDYRLTADGRIGLDRRLDLDGRVRLTAAGVQKLLTMTALPTPGVDLPSLPPIPTNIGGTLADMQIRPDASQVPAATVRALFLGGKGGLEILEAALDGLGLPVDG